MTQNDAENKNRIYKAEKIPFSEGKYTLGFLLRLVIPVAAAILILIPFSNVKGLGSLPVFTVFILVGPVVAVIWMVMYDKEYSGMKTQRLYLIDEKNQVYVMSQNNVAYCKTFADCLRMASNVVQVKKEKPMKGKIAGIQFKVKVYSASMGKQTMYLMLSEEMQGYEDIVQCLRSYC